MSLILVNRRHQYKYALTLTSYINILLIITELIASIALLIITDTNYSYNVASVFNNQ